MSFEYLDSLPAHDVPLYGVVSLERQAIELRRATQLFLLPAEAFGGQGKTIKDLNAEICRMSGVEAPKNVNDPFEELNAKFVRALSDALAAENLELVERLEAAYYLEANEIRRQRQEEIQDFLEDVEVNMRPEVLKALKKKVGDVPGVKN